MLTLWVVDDLYVRVYLDRDKIAIEKPRAMVCVKRDEIAPLIKTLGLALLYLKTEQDAGPTDGTP